MARLHGSLPLRHPPEPCPWPATLSARTMAAREYHCPGWRSWPIRCRPDPAAWWCSLLLLFSEGLLAHQPPGLSQTECIHPALFNSQGAWHISQQNLLHEGALLGDIGWPSAPISCILGALDQATRPRPAFELK